MALMRARRATSGVAVSVAAIAITLLSTSASAAATPAARTSLAVSGTVTDARAEQTVGGVTDVPDTTPPVSGAAIAVDGHVLAHSAASGDFSFDYSDPTGSAATITVTARGFGTYQISGMAPGRAGEVLTVQLTRNRESLDAQATPGAWRAGVAAPASGNCGGYSSNTKPPAKIRVLEFAAHYANGAPVAGTEKGIYSVPFETYVRDVLPNEWIASWRGASLDAGAMAVKTYAWYWVNHWRSGRWHNTCYNVDDSIDYQRYIPGRSAKSTDAAVKATWNQVMTRHGAIFQAGYQATLTGSSAEQCGAGRANYPNTLSQWGSQNCAGLHDSWQKILGVYYPGIAIKA